MKYAVHNFILHYAMLSTKVLINLMVDISQTIT